jgi:hypothetical protein
MPLPVVLVAGGAVAGRWNVQAKKIPLQHVLERGLSGSNRLKTGLKNWCPEEDSNLHTIAGART